MGTNVAFIINELKAIPLMYQLGYKNRKKSGAGLAEEAIEVSKRHPSWVTILGTTKQDAGMITGNLREQGIKILNLQELQRMEEMKNEKEQEE